MLLYERYNNRRRQKSLSFAVFEIFYRFGTAPTVGMNSFAIWLRFISNSRYLSTGAQSLLHFFNTGGVVIKIN